MLSSISWSDFLTTIAIVLLVYYLVVAGIYFRKEIFQLFSSGNSNPQGLHLSNEMDGGPLSYNEMTAATGKEDPYLNGKVHELLEDIKNLLATASQAKSVREELIMALQMLLRNYAILKDLPITTDINQHIMAELKDTCSITLSDAEMNRLWNG